MSEVIVITSGKGGVGKTTTSANLGCGLAIQGKKVALVDADIGLRNLDVVMGLENRIVYDLVDVVEGNCRLKQALIKDKRYEGLFLLPAAQTRDKDAVSPEQMQKLCENLKEEGFDYILIDCSPSLGIITVNALVASHSVIIPVQCEYFALEGISKLLNTIRIIKSRLNPALEIEGFLLTMYDSRLRLANQVYDEVKEHFGQLVFDTVIQRNVKLSEAPSHGLPALLYDADSKGAINHLQLAEELIRRTAQRAAL